MNSKISHLQDYINAWYVVGVSIAINPDQWTDERLKSCLDKDPIKNMQERYADRSSRSFHEEMNQNPTVVAEIAELCRQVNDNCDLNKFKRLYCRVEILLYGDKCDLLFPAEAT